MKKWLMFAFLFVILLSTSGCINQNSIKDTSQEKFNPENSEKVIVTKIVDGDTLIIQGGETIRLLGIDTPEKGEPYYSEAKNYLMNRVLFKEVYLESDIEDKDVYKRSLRWIWFNDSLINLEQIKQGYAISRLYEGEKYQTLIKNAENLAITQNLGIWSQLDNSLANTGINDTQAITLNSSSISSSTSGEACISLGCPSETQYVASKNSDKYHSCSCYNAKRIKQENLLCFSSKEEAEESRSSASCG